MHLFILLYVDAFTQLILKFWVLCVFPFLQEISELAKDLYSFIKCVCALVFAFLMN